MATVYLGVGSNIERERYIVAGLDGVSNFRGVNIFPRATFAQTFQAAA